MMSGVRVARLPALALVLVAGCAKAVEAQRAPAPLPVVRPSGTVQPARSIALPPMESVDRRLAVVRASGLTVQGIMTELRLTPAKPSAPDGTLVVQSALRVEADSWGGSIVLQPDVMDVPSYVAVRFQAALPGRPVLVDFVVDASPGAQPIHLRLSGSGLSESRALATSGAHHVAVIVVPPLGGWYEVTLGMDKAPGYQRLTIHAVDLTVLQ